MNGTSMAHAGQVQARGQVKMPHIDTAIKEMFGAVHMQLLGSCCQLDKLLLASLIMETNAQGAQPGAGELEDMDSCPAAALGA